MEEKEREIENAHTKDKERMEQERLKIKEELNRRKTELNKVKEEREKTAKLLKGMEMKVC
jgi:hypothetical protein